MSLLNSALSRVLGYTSNLNLFGARKGALSTTINVSLSNQTEENPDVSEISLNVTCCIEEPEKKITHEIECFTFSPIILNSTREMCSPKEIC
jgi:hypothetical protein